METPIRWVAATALALVLAACTAGPPQRSPLDELRAELKAVREENARLERRLERMELSRAVLSARPAPPVAPANEVPELTVVKLRPKVDPAPKLDTRTQVVEPSAEMIEAIAQASAAARAARDDGDDDDKEAAPAEMVDAQFDAGLAALRTGNIEGGAVRLRAFADENRKHPKADNALYFAGLGLMGLKDFEPAAQIFEQLLFRYPAGDAVVDGMLKLAECRLRLNQPQDAKALLTKVVLNFPGTAAASLAEARLAALSK